MKTIKTLMAAVVSMLACIGSNAANLNIPTVLIDSAGNSGDFERPSEDPGRTDGYGAVAYEYYIGTTEVTNAQYVTFLNAVAKSDPNGLYNIKMESTGLLGDSGCGIIRSGTDGNYVYTVVAGRENYAVNYVSLFDAARFCNWVTTGDTEIGVYTIVGSDDLGKIIRNAEAWEAGGVALPTVDEWHKAAYYNPADDSYYKYPTSSDSISLSDANYLDFEAMMQGALDVTDAGYGTSSPYGTFGQGGNVWEWNETVVYSSVADIFDRQFYGRLGGSFWTFEDDLSSSGDNNYGLTIDEDNVTGFRVVSLAPILIPEPGTYATIFGLLALGFAAYRKRAIAPKK